MAKYRKKPVEIEAIQWDTGNEKEIAEFMGVDRIYTHPNTGSFPISTLEGTMTAMPGDWVIKGVNGEFYPCKPDIFFKTYDEV